MSHTAIPGGPDHGKARLQALLAAYQAADHDAYRALVDPTLADQMDKAHFTRTATELAEHVGGCQQLEYLGQLRRGHDSWLLWKGRFSLGDGERLIHLQLDSKDAITGFWIV